MVFGPTESIRKMINLHEINNMKNLTIFLACVALLIETASCNTHSSEINTIKDTLLWEKNGESGSWRMNFTYDFVEGIVLETVETMTLQKDGRFREETLYFYNTGLLAKAKMTGKWDVEYDDELDAYFFIQDYDDKLDLQNLNMSEEWFKRFDTDLRLFTRGDAYDALDDEDESDDTIYGNEIIDCNKNLFLVKNLGYDEIYRYEPAKDE